MVTIQQQATGYPLSQKIKAIVEFTDFHASTLQCDSSSHCSCTKIAAQMMKSQMSFGNHPANNREGSRQLGNSKFSIKYNKASLQTQDPYVTLSLCLPDGNLSDKVRKWIVDSRVMEHHPGLRE